MSLQTIDLFVNHGPVCKQATSLQQTTSLQTIAKFANHQLVCKPAANLHTSNQFANHRSVCKPSTNLQTISCCKNQRPDRMLPHWWLSPLMLVAIAFRSSLACTLSRSLLDRCLHARSRSLRPGCKPNRLRTIGQFTNRRPVCKPSTSLQITDLFANHQQFANKRLACKQSTSLQTIDWFANH